MNNSRDKKISSLKDLPHEILKTAYSTGVIAAENERSGSFLHLNQTTVYDQINESFKNQIIMMDTKDALQKYDWLEQYFWKLVDKDKDEFTKRVAEDWSGGYFFWIQKNIFYPFKTYIFCW